MSLEMDWSLDFCLSCDKQTDGQVYCSESCRLAEYEQASSNPSSTASSPKSPSGLFSWPVRPSKTPFFLEPAYNFHNPQPYNHRPTPRRTPCSNLPTQRPRLTSVTEPKTLALTPSTSHTSLLSIHSNNTSFQRPEQPPQLSDESKKALRAYASSFDQSRYSRRQSTR